MNSRKALKSEVAGLDAALNELRKAVEQATLLMRSCCGDLDGLLAALSSHSHYRLTAQSVRDRIEAASNLLDIEIKVPDVSTASVKDAATIGTRSVRSGIDLAAALAQIAALPIAIGAWVAPLSIHSEAATTRLAHVEVCVNLVENAMDEEVRELLDRILKARQSLDALISLGPDLREDDEDVRMARDAVVADLTYLVAGLDLFGWLTHRSLTASLHPIKISAVNAASKEVDRLRVSALEEARHPGLIGREP